MTFLLLALSYLKSYALQALAFLKAHWKVAGPLLALLAAFVAGYVAGRRHCASLPSKQVITETKDTHTQATEKKTEQKAEEVQKSSDTDTRTVTRKKTTITPSDKGPVIVMDEVTIVGKVQAKKSDAKLVDNLHLDQTLRVDEHSVVKTVNIFVAPRWRVGAAVGYQFSKDSGLVYGGELDWRPFPQVPLLLGVRAYKVPNGFQALGSLSVNF